MIPSSLTQGELAINTKDGKLFYGSGSGNIVKEFTGSGGGGGGSTFPYTGSAIITGSLVVTGSTTSTLGFTGSLFGTASFAANGGVTQLLAGSNISLSPTTGVGQVTISSTGGGGGFNTATGSYGSFYSTQTQTNVAGTARSMSLNTTDITNGVSISGSTDPFNTYIKTQNAGVYNIQFSAQIDKSDAGKDEIWIWLRKNGTDLTDTATSIQLTGNADHQVAAWNFFANAAANDYFQLMWYSPDANVRLHAEPAFGVVPGIPSLIVTANRVDQFLSNTGSFSGSFTGNLIGTASFATNSLTASFVNTAGTNAFVQGGNSFGATALLGTNDNQSLAFETSGSTRMFVSSSGNIGIGTSTPTGSLHIVDAGTSFTIPLQINQYFRFRGDGVMRWGIGMAQGILTWDTGKATIGALSGNNLEIFAGGSTKMFISSSGNVGIGTGTPLSPLHVQHIGTSGITGSLRFYNQDSAYTGLFVQSNATNGLALEAHTNGTGYISSNSSLKLTSAIASNDSTIWMGNGAKFKLQNNAETSTYIAVSTAGNIGVGTGAPTTKLHVVGAGATSATTALLIQNSTPTTLFQIQDHGSSSFAGNMTVSGSTLIGNITAPALNDTTKVTANSGVTTIYAIPTASYDGAFFDYVVRSGSNARAGQIMGLWSGSSVNFTETTTTDFGSTSNFTFGMSISSSNMILSSSATSNGWTVKTIVRSI